MDKLVRVVFHGETLEGCDPAVVKREIGLQLTLNPARLDHLFSGKRVVLKRGLDADRAQRHVRQFARLGAKLHIEDDVDEPPATQRAAMPAHTQPPTMLMTPPAPRPAPTPVVPAAQAEPPSHHDMLMAAAAELTLAQAPAPRAAAAIAPAPTAPADAPVRAEPTGQFRFQAGVGLAEQAPPLLGVGFRGRLSRHAYAQASAVTFLLGYLVLLFVMKHPDLGRIVLGALLALPLGLYATRLCVLRCHDANRSGWWALLLLVPVLGLLAALVLAWLPSTEGDNRYGEMPDEGSKMATRLVTGACALAVALLIRPALNAIEKQAAQAAIDAAHAPPQLEPAADRAFHIDYAASPGHKAFAVAPGAFGWKGGAASADEAEEAALVACEDQRRAAMPNVCEVVHVDGNWLGRTAQPAR